jgi:hypothetical protein
LCAHAFVYNRYFSWDAGLVHYVAISTELYFGVEGGADGNLKAMYEWIDADLERANANRANVPWIVAHGHRAIYCSGGKDCDEQVNITTVTITRTCARALWSAGDRDTHVVSSCSRVVLCIVRTSWPLQTRTLM